MSEPSTPTPSQCVPEAAGGVPGGLASSRRSRRRRHRPRPRRRELAQHGRAGSLRRDLPRRSRRRSAREPGRPQPGVGRERLVRTAHAPRDPGDGHLTHRPDRHRVDDLQRARADRPALRITRSVERRSGRMEPRDVAERRRGPELRARPARRPRGSVRPCARRFHDEVVARWDGTIPGLRVPRRAGR